MSCTSHKFVVGALAPKLVVGALAPKLVVGALAPKLVVGALATTNSTKGVVSKYPHKKLVFSMGILLERSSPRHNPFNSRYLVLNEARSSIRCTREI